MVAGGLTFAFPGAMPEAYAANENLFVSAEKSEFNNYVAGPQIVEIVIIDNNLSDIDEAVGAPDVTVNGADLQMVQATDGNWYAYMADLDFAEDAHLDSDNGLNYGTGGRGDDVLQAADPRIILEGPDGLYLGADDVIREPKEINANDGAAGIGQIRLNSADDWPFIQLYELSQGGNFVIQYNKAGGAQTTTLTFDTVDDFAGVTLDRTKYPQGGHVHATVTDAWLNIDPTDEDSWTFVDGEMFYQIFDENGRSETTHMGSVDGGALMCGDGCDFTVDVATQGNPVMRFDDNSNANVTSRIQGEGITITEAGPNTGIFTTYDEQDDSMLIITDDARRGTTATINYADTPQSVLVGFDFASIDIEPVDATWNSGEAIPVTLMDEDLNKNTRVDEDIDLSDPTFNIIPALRTGTPLTLAAGAENGALTGTFGDREITVRVDDVSDVGRITLDDPEAQGQSAELAEPFSLESLADLLSIEMVPVFAQTTLAPITLIETVPSSVTVTTKSSTVNVQLVRLGSLSDQSRSISTDDLFESGFNHVTLDYIKTYDASPNFQFATYDGAANTITLTLLEPTGGGNSNILQGNTIVVATAHYDDGETFSITFNTTTVNSGSATDNAGSQRTVREHTSTFTPYITSQVNVTLANTTAGGNHIISIPLTDIFEPGYTSLPTVINGPQFTRIVEANSTAINEGREDTFDLLFTNARGGGINHADYSFEVIAFYPYGPHVATVNVDVDPSNTPNREVGLRTTHIAQPVASTHVDVTLGTSGDDRLISIPLSAMFDEAYDVLPTVLPYPLPFTRTIVANDPSPDESKEDTFDLLFTRTFDALDQDYVFRVLADYTNGTTHLATVAVDVGSHTSGHTVGERATHTIATNTLPTAPDFTVTVPNGGAAQFDVDLKPHIDDAEDADSDLTVELTSVSNGTALLRIVGNSTTTSGDILGTLTSEQILSLQDTNNTASGGGTYSYSYTVTDSVWPVPATGTLTIIVQPATDGGDPPPEPTHRTYPVNVTLGLATATNATYTQNDNVTIPLRHMFDDDAYVEEPTITGADHDDIAILAGNETAGTEDRLFVRHNNDAGAEQPNMFNVTATYEGGSTITANVTVNLDEGLTEAASYTAQFGSSAGGTLEINLGITGNDFMDAISTNNTNFSGFDLLNYDVRSITGVDEICFDFNNSTGDDDYCNDIEDTPQGLMIIGQSENVLDDGVNRTNLINNDFDFTGFDGDEFVNLILVGAQALEMNETYPIVVDIFSYGFTDDGVQAGERTADQIIRFELEESGDDTGKFEGTLEYVMLNQLNILDPATYDITTISNEPSFIVMEDLTDEDSPRVTYADLGADGVVTPISDQQEAPSISGIVTLNQESYKIADTVIINVTDADLNVDSDLLEIYTVVRPENHTDPDYDQVGRDMSGDLEDLSFGSLGRLLDVTFDDVKWQDTGAACIDDPDYDDGLGATDFTLRETGADTGVFIGDFQIPAEWCRPGATDPETTTGLDIEVNYVDFRDASGEIIEVGDSAGVRASTGSVSLDRTVYPVPFDADDFPLHESVDGTLPAGDLQVHVRVNDPDYNVNPSGEDTIAEDLQGPVQISVLRGSDRVILGYAGGETRDGIITTNDTGAGINASRWLGPISEVAPDAGIYELDVTIESTHGPDGIILQGDILQVQYTDPTDASGEPNSVTDSATFDLRNGVLQTDKTVYIIGSDMILTIIDPDLNLDSDAAETYDLDLVEWDSDAATTTMGNAGVDAAAFDPEPSDFRETGDNTGIFQVVVEIPAIIDGDRLERGEQIDLEYTDWGPSGADFVGDESEDVNAQVFTSNFGATIELDQKVYTWTDKVYVTIVAPDHNFDSDLIDEIGESPDDPIRVSTRSADIDNYRLVETGTDTGIFTGEVILTGFRHDADGDGTDEFMEERISDDGSGPTDGLLPAGDDDGLTVSFEFSEDETVVGSALIRWNIGEVQWLEASYPASGTGVVRIIDPDMNLNPEAVDNFNVDVWSDSDAGGIDLTVTETNEATGIFEGNVFFTTNDDSSGHRLNVAEGDTVTAEYEDNTLPDPYTTADELDITATSLIGTIVPPLERVQVSNLRIVDAFESSLDSVSIDQQVQISADLASGQDREQAFAYLVQVQDDNGVTVSLAWIAGSLSPGQSFSPSLSWIPSDAGSYSVTVFVWESVDNPTALSPPVTTTITVN